MSIRGPQLPATVSRSWRRCSHSTVEDREMKTRRRRARFSICIPCDNEHRWHTGCPCRTALVTGRAAGSDEGRKPRRRAARRGLFRRDGDVTRSDRPPTRQFYPWPRRYRGKTKQTSIGESATAQAANRTKGGASPDYLFGQLAARLHRQSLTFPQSRGYSSMKEVIKDRAR